MMQFEATQWALILGGSSGFGLAAADKLSQLGMSVAVVHRDRRGAMERIQPSFDAIAARGRGFRAFNVDALSNEGREKVLAGLRDAMGSTGRVRMVMHSIAFGNLRLLAPMLPAKAHLSDELGQALSIDPEQIRELANQRFQQGNESFMELADPAKFDNGLFLEDEDFARTVYAMGTSLVSWVQAIHRGSLFAADARVIAMTSEGNRAAWRGYAAVSAAKSALEACARAIAMEYAPHGIRANIIQAGVSDTAALRAIPGHQQLLAQGLRRNPFGRLTTPEDVAGVIALLCTDEAQWVNGSLLVVDGGEHLG